MFLLLFVLLILAGLLIKNEYKHYDLLVIVFATTMSYFGKNVPDVDNYSNVFNHIAAGDSYSDTGLGWYYICKIGGSFGLNYLQLKVVIIFISFFLIKVTVDYYLKNRRSKNIAWTLFLIYPLLFELVQVRFFLAESIVIFAFRFLCEKKVSGYVKYCILVLVAFIIHTSCVFYFVFAIIPVFSRSKKVLPYLVLILSSVAIFGKKMLVNIASLVVNTARIERYLSSLNSAGISGVIAYSVTVILFIILSKAMVSELYKHKVIEKEVNLIKSFEQLTMLVALVLPLTLFDTDFFRLQRPMWIMLYICLMVLFGDNVNSISIRNVKVRNKTLGIMMAIYGILVFICIYNMVIIQSFLL